MTFKKLVAISILAYSSLSAQEQTTRESKMAEMVRACEQIAEKNKEYSKENLALSDYIWLNQVSTDPAIRNYQIALNAYMTYRYMSLMEKEDLINWLVMQLGVNPEEIASGMTLECAICDMQAHKEGLDVDAEASKTMEYLESAAVKMAALVTKTVNDILEAERTQQ
jgi:predicted metal-binding transcription factor (methanogenesis marker protein 9)